MFVRSISLTASLLAGVLSLPALGAAPKDVSLAVLGQYSTGIFDGSAAEIVAYHPGTQRLFVVNAKAVSVDVLNTANPANIVKVASIDASAFGAGVNSVAVHNGIVAVAIEADDKQANGTVAFYNAASLKLLNTVAVGALPDMLIFTPNGRFVLVANEGEPNDDYSVDPEGSVSVIDLRRGVKKASVKTADFKRFIGKEDALRARGIRIFGPGANAAQDFEPEYITVSSDSKTAWVALQENNAFAVIDIKQAKVARVIPLGVKDHNLLGNELDASDKDEGVNIQTWPVKGFYMPDTIKSYNFRGDTFILTANEGDSRDYDGYSEEERVKDLNLDPTVFPNADEIQQSEQLGRLKVTTANGDTDGDGDFDELRSYGARSFSIRNARGRLIFDSGSEIELVTSAALGDNFNSTNDENDTGDSRSDDKGPEPEAIEVAHIAGRTYAFVGLERVGGIMIYDITNPHRVRYLNYINNRNFDVAAQLPDGSTNPEVGDLGVESLLYIPPKKSPNGKPLLVSANEVSGTTTVFEIKLTRAKKK